jgi:thiopeptide-type bacteriocin biosynthesis protein
VQVNLLLSAHNGSFHTSSWPLLEQLWALLQTWRQTAPVACWFVRKSPGIRLRLSGPGFDITARSAFVALLDHEVAQGNLVRWWYSTYEPETYRLGGPVALMAVHILLSADTTVWLGWERLSRQGGTRLSEDVMALALYSDLLLRATEGHEEAWDIWCALHRIYAEALPEAPRESSPRRYLLLPQELHQLANEAERVCLDEGFAANEQFAHALERVWEQGELVGGRRALLATLASFHWNIWCLRPQVVAPLCRAMVRELHPAAAFLPSVSLRREG